jgi:signal transduction histidine kinase
VGEFLDRASRESQGKMQIRWVWLDASAQPHERPRFSGLDTNLRAGETFSFVADDDQGQRFLFTYVPLQLSLTRPGALEFAESLAPLERQVWRDGLLTLGLIGLVALASIVTAYVTGINWIAKPLGQLIEKTQRIGQGDFDQPLHLAQRDEMGQLADALNEMCGQLQRQQTALAAEAENRLNMLDQLRHADRLKTVGRLAAGVGHELGTPLNVISGRAGLIAGGQLPSGEIASSARTIKEEADRVTHIVRQLLDFARRTPPRRAEMDVKQVLERTIELLQPIAERQGVQIEWDASETVASRGACLAQADPAQLQQVFTNLMVNAIQAMPQDGRLRIAIESWTRPAGTATEANGDEAFWKIGFIDNGTGIAPEHIELIFEPFFTTREVNEGTGLGLSIAYGIMQEHGGWIEVHSQLGSGSRFDVFLPKGNR